MKEYVTYEELYAAYYHCRRNKRRKASSLAFELHYEQYLRELYYELNTMTYEISTSIVFGVTRPKDREVFAADFRDRVVHHLIMDKLEPILEAEMIDDSYNCRKGKGTFYGVRCLQEKIKRVSNDYTKQTWCLSFDMQGFFMSIDKDKCWQMVQHTMTHKWTYGNLSWWLWLVEKVIKNRPEQNCEIHGDRAILDRLPDNKTLFRSNGKGLPIGNLTSQIFGNYYLTKFDKWSQDYIEGIGEYCRYVDDGRVISTDKNLLKGYSNEAARKLSELGVKLHPRKWSIQDVSKGVKFVGSVIMPHRIYTSNRTISNALAVSRKHNVKDYERHTQKLNSYMGFLVHGNTYAIRWSIYNSIPPDIKKNLVCTRMRKYIPIHSRRCSQFAGAVEFLKQNGKI